MVPMPSAGIRAARSHLSSSSLPSIEVASIVFDRHLGGSPFVLVVLVVDQEYLGKVPDALLPGVRRGFTLDCLCLDIQHLILGIIGTKKNNRIHGQSIRNAVLWFQDFNRMCDRPVHACLQLLQLLNLPHTLVLPLSAFECDIDLAALCARSRRS